AVSVRATSDTVREKPRDPLGTAADAGDRLCELNVIEQVANVCQTTIARDAWERGQELSVHGWIYGIADGLSRDLGTTVSDFREAAPICHAAVAKLLAPQRARQA